MSELLKIGRNDLGTIQHQDLVNRQTDKDIVREMVSNYEKLHQSFLDRKLKQEEDMMARMDKFRVDLENPKSDVYKQFIKDFHKKRFDEDK